MKMQSPAPVIDERIGKRDKNYGYPDAEEIMKAEEGTIENDNSGGMMENEAEQRQSGGEIAPEKLAAAQVASSFKTIQNLLIAIREKGNPIAAEAMEHFNALMNLLSGKSGSMQKEEGSEQNGQEQEEEIGEEQETEATQSENDQVNEMAFNPFKPPKSKMQKGKPVVL